MINAAFNRVRAARHLSRLKLCALGLCMTFLGWALYLAFSAAFLGLDDRCQCVDQDSLIKNSFVKIDDVDIISFTLLVAPFVLSITLLHYRAYLLLGFLGSVLLGIGLYILFPLHAFFAVLMIYFPLIAATVSFLTIDKWLSGLCSAAERLIIGVCYYLGVTLCLMSNIQIAAYYWMGAP